MLYVVGLGPGAPGLLTPDAAAAIEAADAVTQYSMTLSSSSSRPRTFSGCPSQSVHAQNFSRIHDA